MSARICIILLNHNQKGCILSSLNALLPRNRLVTPLVVDQGSTDGSVPAIRAAYPHVPIFENRKNLGVAGGNNEAIQWILIKRFQWILLLGSPVTIPPGYVTRWQEALKEHPETKFFRSTCQLVSFIHRSVFETIGLFDPRFSLFWDRLDYMQRAERKGFEIKTISHEPLKFHSPFSIDRSAAHYFWWRGYLLWIQRNHPTSERNYLFKQSVRPKIRKLCRDYFLLLFQVTLFRKKKALPHLACIRASLRAILNFFFLRSFY